MIVSVSPYDDVPVEHRAGLTAEKSCFRRWDPLTRRIVDVDFFHQFHAFGASFAFLAYPHHIGEPVQNVPGVNERKGKGMFIRQN